MDDGELGCVSRCAEKYLKLTSRAGFRFAEFQSQSQVGRYVWVCGWVCMWVGCGGVLVLLRTFGRAKWID